MLIFIQMIKIALASFKLPVEKLENLCLGIRFDRSELSHVRPLCSLHPN